MPGKKAHHPRKLRGAGTHDVHSGPDQPRKSGGETQGQFSRDSKGRQGQYTTAGNPALIKK